MIILKYSLQSETEEVLYSVMHIEKDLYLK
jgi:hypothetical protein